MLATLIPVILDWRAARPPRGVRPALRQLAVQSADARRRPLIRRRPFHRAVFAAAGLYNIAWGTHAVVDPQWFFRWAGMPLASHPEVFACLGMVIGLYGILYLDVARRPERGWLLAAVGLAGKTLGPIGWLVLVCAACGRPAHSCSV